MNEQRTTNNEKPLVSVCIGVYNRERYIRACIDSVLAQTYPNMEIVVVDDASTDGSVNEVRTYGDRVRLIEREVNSRCADIPRAQAVAAASGAWCALLDSDDLWCPEKLEKQMAAVATYPDRGMWHSYVRVKDEYRDCEYIRHEGHITDGPHVARELLEHCFVCTSSVLVRRKIWLEAFEEVKPETFGIDWDMFLAIARKYPVGFIPEALVTYRKASIGISRQNWKRVESDLPGCVRIYQAGLWKGVVTRSGMKRKLIESACRGAIHWRDRHEYRRALWFGLQGLKYQPLSGRLWLEVGKTVGRMAKHRFKGEGNGIA